MKLRFKIQYLRVTKVNTGPESGVRDEPGILVPRPGSRHEP